MEDHFGSEYYPSDEDELVYDISKHGLFTLGLVGEQDGCPVVHVSLPLGSYIEAIRYKESNEEQYDKIRSSIMTDLEGAKGDILWDKVVENTSVDPSLQNEFQYTALYTLMTTYFRDMVANSIDSILKYAYEHQEEDFDDAVLTMSVVFDFRDENLFTVSVSDNSVGFSENYLNTLNQAVQDNVLSYVYQKHVSEKGRNSPIGYIGGAGKGVRGILKDAYFFPSLKSHERQSEPRPHTHIAFSNHEEGGATITITMSRLSDEDLGFQQNYQSGSPMHYKTPGQQRAAALTDTPDSVTTSEDRSTPSPSYERSPASSYRGKLFIDTSSPSSSSSRSSADDVQRPGSRRP